MRWLKFAIPLMTFISLLVFLGIGLSKDPRLVPSPLIGKPAPEFRLPSLLDTNTQLTETMFKNRISLLNVWASWCPECWREHHFLMQLNQQGIPIIGLNYKDEKHSAQAMLKKAGNPFKSIIFDQQGLTGIDYGVYGAPETFLIDHKGIIHYKHIGQLNTDIWQQHFLPLIAQLKADMQ